MYSWYSTSCVRGIAFTVLHVMCSVWCIRGIPHVVFVAMHSWYPTTCVGGIPCDVLVAMHSWLVCMWRARGRIDGLHCIRFIAFVELYALHWLHCIRCFHCIAFIVLHSLHSLHSFIVRYVLVPVHHVTWLVCHVLQDTASHCDTRQHTSTRVRTLHYV